jgi:hypothetical protein
MIVNERGLGALALMVGLLEPYPIHHHRLEVHLPRLPGAPAAQVFPGPGRLRVEQRFGAEV